MVSQASTKHDEIGSKMHGRTGADARRLRRPSSVRLCMPTVGVISSITIWIFIYDLALDGSKRSAPLAVSARRARGIGVVEGKARYIIFES